MADTLLEDKLRFWRDRWDALSDREQSYHEVKLGQDIRTLRIAMGNAKGDADRLTTLTKVYQDKQAEHGLIYGGQDF